MDFFKSKFLIYPIVIFFGIFLLDKIFFLPIVIKNTQPWNKIESYFYNSRRALLKQLLLEYPERVARGERLGIIFGTSRAGDFDTDYISRKYKNTYTYNFSAPFSCPSYYFYWLEKILNSGIKISYVIIEADPVIFSPMSIRYSLSYSYDLPFILKNIDLNRPVVLDPYNIKKVFRMDIRGFSFDEVETFLLKRFFALYSYPPDPKAFIDNNRIHPVLQKNGHQFRKTIVTFMGKANMEKLGGIPNPLLISSSPEQITKQSKEDVKKYLVNFKPSPTQVFFFKRTLREMAEKKIKIIIYWPLAPQVYRNEMEKLGLVNKIQREINEQVSLIKKDYPDLLIKLVDLQNVSTMKCRLFVDSYHLSGGCYNQLTDHLLEEIK